MPLDLSRRYFLTGLSAGVIAAPAIVRAASLMPIKALEREIGFDALLGPGDRAPYLTSLEEMMARLQSVTRRAFLPRLNVQLYQSRPFLSAMLQPDA